MPAKTEKSTSTSPGRVFDVAKPASASATARPVIVSNRPIIQDPMVVKSDDTAASTNTSPSAVKIKLQPLGEEASDTKVEVTKAASPAEPKTETAAESPAEATVSDTDSKVPTDTPEAKAPESDNAEPEKTQDAPGADAADAADSPAADTSDAAEAIPGEVGPEAANAEADAAAKQREELNKLIESRKYALPINSVERRRSKITAVLGLVLIVVLGLLLLDVCLDAGFIHIQGVHALTHIFSA